MPCLVTLSTSMNSNDMNRRTAKFPSPRLTTTKQAYLHSVYLLENAEISAGTAPMHFKMRHQLGLLVHYTGDTSYMDASQISMELFREIYSKNLENLIFRNLHISSYHRSPPPLTNQNTPINEFRIFHLCIKLQNIVDLL